MGLDRVELVIAFERYLGFESTVAEAEAAHCAIGRRYRDQLTTIRSRYNIYTTVLTLTADLYGIDYFEIAPIKRFVEDFGISYILVVGERGNIHLS